MKYQKVNLNGEVLSKDKIGFDTIQRAFAYGDGIFETIRVINGKMPFLEKHIERSLNGLKILKFNIQEYYSPSFFKKEIKKLITKKSEYRIRLSFFRESGGLYYPKNNNPVFLIEASPLSKPLFELNKKGLKSGFYSKMKFFPSQLSSFKTLNGLPYILPSIYAKKKGWDDCILLDYRDKIIETTSSNIFIFLKNKFITTPLSSGCVDGVMRSIIINFLKKEKNYNIIEKSISPKDILKAEEVFFTNAIQGIKWVEKIGKNRFGNKKTKKITKKLRKLYER